jgi:hypothetical protein
VDSTPGRLRETGIGVIYQRMIWKGLFAVVEILPQLKTYLDENDKKPATVSSYILPIIWVITFPCSKTEYL